MRCLKHVPLLFLLGFANLGFAKELSLLSGFYRGQEGDGQPSKKEVSIGSRFGLDITDRSMWYVQARISSTSYSGDNAPDGSTGLLLGGGQYYFLKSFTKDLHSYLSWLAYFENEKDEPNATTSIERNGLYYAATAGFRFDFTNSIVFDMEVQFFNSGLTAKQTTSTTVAGVTTKTTETKTEFYAQTFAAGTDSLLFNLGYQF